MSGATKSAEVSGAAIGIGDAQNCEIMAVVPGALRWHRRALQQLWRGTLGAEEWRDVPDSASEEES